MHVFLLSRMARQLKNTMDLINDTLFKSAVLSLNLDVMELGLRRRMMEMSISVPNNMTKRLWDYAFGPLTFAVNWDVFERKMLRTWCPDILARANHVKAFLCFPDKDVVSIQSLSIFCNLYGPENRMWHNFRNLIGPGFVGIVNAINAETMLLTTAPMLRTLTYIIRYSRTYPDLFTITTIDTDSGITNHYRNIDSEGKIVPIHRHIELFEKLGYQKGLFSLGEDSVTPSATNIARTPFSRYIVNPYGVGK